MRLPRRLRSVTFAGSHSSSAKLSDADTLVVFYRGGWCPYCNFQIRELSQSHEKFEALGVSLVATASMGRMRRP